MLHHFHMSGPTQPVGSLPWGLWEGAGWRAWCTLDWDAWKAESRAVDKAVLICFVRTGAWCGTLYTNIFCHHLTANHEGLWIAADMNFGGGSCDIKDHYWQGGYTAISEQLCPVSSAPRHRKFLVTMPCEWNWMNEWTCPAIASIVLFFSDLFCPSRTCGKAANGPAEPDVVASACLFAAKCGTWHMFAINIF